MGHSISNHAAHGEKCQVTVTNNSEKNIYGTPTGTIDYFRRIFGKKNFSPSYGYLKFDQKFVFCDLGEKLQLQELL